MPSLVATLFASSNGGSFIGGLIGFVIWRLIMVWIYNIAKRKGRHAFGWLILGFFFSIIALIVVALLPSKRTTREYQGY
jgi:hypothetical protein